MWHPFALRQHCSQLQHRIVWSEEQAASILPLVGEMAGRPKGVWLSAWLRTD
ncbi:hypothetical protein GGE07_003404 [Sinorhizobium terangae]|nr:hypothetical protein [Sinorhizobium terangae]